MDEMWTKVMSSLACALGLFLFGCVPEPPDMGDDDDVVGDDDAEGDDDFMPDDDDDDAVGDDDDAVGDDDDAVGDDDDVVGDDDDLVGDDDDHVGGCPNCVYEFAITFNTQAQTGQCVFCWDLDDGTWDLGYGSGAVYLYSTAYSAWYWWYYASANGNVVDFYYDNYYLDYAVVQEGYWDVSGGGSAMTGRASTVETTDGQESYRRVQQLQGTAN